MKQVLLLVFLISTSLCVTAQEVKRNYFFDIEVSPYTYVFDQNSYSTPNLTYSFGYFFTPKFSLRYIMGNTLVLDNNNNYDLLSSVLGFGAGYYVWEGERDKIEISSDFSMGFSNLYETSDYDSFDVILKYYFNNIFIGCGFKSYSFYEQDNLSTIQFNFGIRI